MGTSIIGKARHIVFAGVLTFALALGFILTGVITSATSETGCSWGIEKAYAAKYTLSEKSLTLNVGGYWTISVNETTKAEDKKVKWSSSNTRVAKVKKTKDKNGNYVCKITAVGSGTCTVKALVKGKTCKCKVKVNPFVFKADRDDVTVEVGETAATMITFTGYGTVSFQRSNTSVAEVSWSKNWTNNTTELYIKGLKPGTMSIRLTNNLTSDSFSINVTVPSEYPNSVTYSFEPDGLHYNLVGSQTSTCIQDSRGGVYEIKPWSMQWDEIRFDVTCIKDGGDGFIRYKVYNAGNNKIEASGIIFGNPYDLESGEAATCYIPDSFVYDLMKYNIPIRVKLYFD